ncbi:MAG TPA: GNAT family N-acetyltransferase [Kofleriaceae bacterium]
MSKLSSAPPRAVVPRLEDLDLVLVTARLRLRPLQDSDVEDLWPFVSDPELPRMMSWAAHTDRSQTRAFIEWAKESFARGSDLVWAIEVDGRAMGTISLDRIQYAQRAWRIDRAELGYWIAPPLWRRGMMTEAAQAVVRCGFEALCLHKINVRCLAQNAGSRRVIEKLGFRLIGQLEDDVWRDGRWWSVLAYELTQSEWTDVSTTLRINRPRPP